MRRGNFIGLCLSVALGVLGCDDPLVYPLKSPVTSEAGVALDAGTKGNLADAGFDAGGDASFR